MRARTSSTSQGTDLTQGALRRAKSGSAALPAGIVHWLVEWLDDWRELRPIGELDEHLLRDLGLTKADALGSTITTSRRDATLKTRKER